MSVAASMWMAESKNYWGQIIPNGDFEAYGHYSELFLSSSGPNDFC